jgi:hypothetical protein
MRDQLSLRFPSFSLSLSLSLSPFPLFLSCSFSYLSIEDAAATSSFAIDRQYLPMPVYLAFRSNLTHERFCQIVFSVNRSVFYLLRVISGSGMPYRFPRAFLWPWRDLLLAESELRLCNNDCVANDISQYFLEAPFTSSC